MKSRDAIVRFPVPEQAAEGIRLMPEYYQARVHDYIRTLYMEIDARTKLCDEYRAEKIDNRERGI